MTYATRSISINALFLSQPLQFVPAALTNRILDEARAQQEEIDAGDEGELGTARDALAAAMQGLGRTDADSDDDEDGDGDDALSDPGSGWDEEEYEVAAEDEAALAAFMAPGSKNHKQKTLADVIMEKIRAKQEEAGMTPAARWVHGGGS